MVSNKPLVTNAVWANATLWSCWGCSFLLKLVDEEIPGDPWAPIREADHSADEVREEEGGQCLFWERVELGVREDISNLLGSGKMETPCGIPFFSLCKGSSFMRSGH